MNDIITAHWPLFVIGTVVVIALLWWLLLASRRTRIAVDRRDTLDEGAAPAARNQALIDAAPVAQVAVPPIVPEAIGGAGIAVAAAVEEAHLRAAKAAETKVAETTGADDLTRIKGLGPKLAATLNDLGVAQFVQIAGWSEADIDRIDGQLGRFQGRIRRDEWVEQARLLAAGDSAGFEERFGAS